MSAPNTPALNERRSPRPRKRVSQAILPLISSAESRGSAFVIAMGATSAALGLASGTFAALHDLDLSAVDDITLAEEVLKYMRERSAINDPLQRP